MKKIILTIILLFSFNVYAVETNYKDFSCEVIINGETYVAYVKYEGINDLYHLDDSSIVLTNSKGEVFKDNGNEPYAIRSIGGGYCLNQKNIYACNDTEKEFSLEQISNEEYMMDYVPKFIDFKNQEMPDGKAAFLYYTADETYIRNSERKEFLDSLKKFYYVDKNVEIFGQTNNGPGLPDVEEPDPEPKPDNPSQDNSTEDSPTKDFAKTDDCGSDALQAPSLEACNKAGGIATVCGIPYGLSQMINDAFNLLKIGVPIVLIIMGLIDLVKAIVGQKEDDIKKGWNTFAKRVLYGIAVFFVFFLVQFIVSLLPGSSGKNNISGCVKSFFGYGGSNNGAVCCITKGANTKNNDNSDNNSTETDNDKNDDSNNN